MMDRFWMWLGLAVLSAAVIGVAGALSGPAPSLAEGGTTLTQPIPPVPDAERVGRIRDQIGWTAAKARWGMNMPMGRGVPVGQVEGGRDYLPNTHHGGLPGTGFIPESGASGISGHGTNVAVHAFGPDSAGQGVRAVHCFSANDWIGAGFLNTGTTDPPRDDRAARVYNHSWISDGNPAAPLVLRRLDYAVDAYDVLVVAGVNNSNGDIPDLLASAYNVISVGVSDGNNSDGLTRIEGAGRCKPEIVAPGGLTSWSTGVVTGCVAALLEAADRKLGQEPEGRGRYATRSEVIKAVLLGGAYKPEGWAPPDGEPLDRKLGAGVVDLDRSILMLEGGGVEPDTKTDQRYAWSFGTIEHSAVRTISFDLDAEQGASDFTLVWHRRVLGGTTQLENPQTGEEATVWNHAQFLPNLELALFKAEPDGGETIVGISRSKIDNVELIHLPSLEPGQYALRVARVMDGDESAWDYALAWKIEAQEPGAGEQEPAE